MRPAARRRKVEAGGKVLESLRIEIESSLIIHQPPTSTLGGGVRRREAAGGGALLLLCQPYLIFVLKGLN